MRLKYLLIILAPVLAVGQSLPSQQESDDADFPGPQVVATITDAYDGDTVSVAADLWPDLQWTGNVRLRGIDTPEIRARCDLEYSLAITVRDYVRLLIGQRVLLTDVQRDRYGGRVVANVWLANGLDLSEHLLSLGYARAYQGGLRETWCSDFQRR